MPVENFIQPTLYTNLTTTKSISRNIILELWSTTSFKASAGKYCLKSTFSVCGPRNFLVQTSCEDRIFHFLQGFLWRSSIYWELHRSEYIFCIAHRWGKETILFSSAEKSELPLALDITSETSDNLIFENTFWYNSTSGTCRRAATELRFSSVQYGSPPRKQQPQVNREHNDTFLQAELKSLA